MAMILTPLLHQGSMSSMFYEQLLCTQIPKVQKTDNLTVYFAISGSALVKFTPDYTNIL